MKYLVSLASKYIKRQKFRTCLTFISIVLASFILNMGLITLSSAILSLKQYTIDSMGTWEVNLTDYVDKEKIPQTLEKLQKHILVDDILYYNNSYVRVPFSDKSSYIEVSYDKVGKLLCKSVNQKSMCGNPLLVREFNIRAVHVHNDNGIILPEVFREYGYKEGNSITLGFTYICDKYRGKTYTDSFVIEGFSESAESGTGIMDVWIKENKDITSQITAGDNLDKKSEISLSSDSDSGLYIRVNKNGKFDDCTNTILSDIESENNYLDLLSDPDAFNSRLLLMELKALINPKHIVPIIAILAGLLLLFWLVERFIIDNAFEISVVERSRKFTVLKTLGASKGQLSALTFNEAVFYCVTAVPIGMVTAYIIILSLFKSFSFIGIRSMVFSSNPAILAVGFVLCVISVVISSYTSAMWNTRKSTLIKAMNYGNSVKIKKKKVKDKKYLNKSSIQLIKTYSKRNMKRAKGKYIFSAFAGSVSMILLFSALFTATGIKTFLKENEDFFSSPFASDFRISVLRERPENIFNFFKKGEDIIQCRVKGTYYGYNYAFSEHDKQIYEKFSGNIPEVFSLETIDKIQYDEEIKDILKLSYDEFVDQKSAILVVMTDDAGNSGTCFRSVSEYGFESEPEITFGKSKIKISGVIITDVHINLELIVPIENISDKKLSWCDAVITVKDSKAYKKASDLCTEFVDTNPNVEYYMDDYIHNTGFINTMSALGKTAIVFFVFTWLTGIVSMINLTNTRIMNCQREYFIMRCLGMSKRQIVGSVLYDLVFFSVISTFMGILFSSVMILPFLEESKNGGFYLKIIRNIFSIGIPASVIALAVNICIPVLFAMPLIKKMFETSSDVVNTNDLR